MREVVCSDPACKWSGQRVEHVSEVLNTCPVCKAGTLFSKLPIGELLAEPSAIGQFADPSTYQQANHRDITVWGSISYWQHGVAVTSSDRWDEAHIVIKPNNVDAFRVNSRTSLDNHKWALDRAFEAGRAAKTAEFRKLLDIK